MDGWVLGAVGEGVPITVPTQGLAKLTRFVGWRLTHGSEAWLGWFLVLGGQATKPTPPTKQADGALATPLASQFCSLTKTSVPLGFE